MHFAFCKGSAEKSRNPLHHFPIAWYNPSAGLFLTCRPSIPFQVFNASRISGFTPYSVLIFAMDSLIKWED
jgi:hypothetical protein